MSSIVLDILRRNTDSENQWIGRNLKIQIYCLCCLHMEKLGFRDVSIILEFVLEPGTDPRRPQCFVWHHPVYLWDNSEHWCCPFFSWHRQDSIGIPGAWNTGLSSKGNPTRIFKSTYFASKVSAVYRRGNTSTTMWCIKSRTTKQEQTQAMRDP